MERNNCRYGGNSRGTMIKGKAEDCCNFMINF